MQGRSIRMPLSDQFVPLSCLLQFPFAFTSPQTLFNEFSYPLSHSTMTSQQNSSIVSKGSRVLKKVFDTITGSDTDRLFALKNSLHGFHVTSSMLTASVETRLQQNPRPRMMILKNPILDKPEDRIFTEHSPATRAARTKP